MSDLLPPPPAQNAHVVDVANANKLANLDFMKIVAARCEANIRQCWNDPQHTAQEFLDQYGTKAKAAMEMSRALAHLLLRYEQESGITLVDHNVLALAGEWTGHDDGTVTVN